MFYPGTKVGCCAIMHEERGGRSKEASSKGGKQRQTGLCLPVALLGLGGGLLQESQHTHTNLSFIQSHSKFYLFLLLHRQTHTLSLGRKSTHVCVRVFVRMHTWMHQCRCQSAIVQTSSCRPPAPSSTWGGRRGAQWSRRLDGGEKEKRKERKRGEEGRDGEKATKEKGQLNEKDLTAVDCHLWRPAAVKAKEFVGLWCYCPAYFSSLPFLSLSFFPLLPPLCCPPPYFRLDTHNHGPLFVNAVPKKRLQVNCSWKPQKQSGQMGPPVPSLSQRGFWEIDSGEMNNSSFLC